MYSRRFWVGTLAFSLCFGPLAGCGKDEDEASKTAKRVAEVVCPKAYQCCTPMQLMGNDVAGADVASCESKTEESFRNRFKTLEDSEKKGRVVYHPERVNACLARVASATCDSLNTTNHLGGVPECASFVEPRQSVDQPCAFDWECVDGKCEKAVMAAEGVCKAAAGGLSLAPEGAACTGTAQCASGRCSSTGAGGVCLAPTADRCFYASACSYAAHAPKASVGFAVMALAFVSLAARRRRG